MIDVKDLAGALVEHFVHILIVDYITVELHENLLRRAQGRW